MFDLSWGNGSFLWFLLIIPVLVGSYIAYWAWKNRVARKLQNKRLLVWRSGRKQVLRFVLLVLGIFFCILAVARPQWGEKQRKVTREGIDLVLALDISKSMLAADVNPSRLRAAKDEMIRVLQQLRGDRVGLVVFTGVSFAQSPLTADYSAIKFYLRRLDPDDMPVGGTASGRALLDSVELLTGEKIKRSGPEKTESPQDFKRSRSQVIVLVTDGEDHQGDPIEAAKIAAERGIQIYPIGFGSDKGEPIPVYSKDGRLQGYKKDRKGNTVYTKLNDAPLKEIASITGGQYFHYDGRGSMANAITSTLNELEKEELEALLRVEKEDRYPLFLWPGLFFLLLSTWLGERRGFQWAFWHRYRSHSGASSLAPWLLIPVASLALLNEGCDSLHESLVMTKLAEIEEGNRLLKSGENEAALQSYKSGEKKVPASPQLHYDLGLGFLETGDLDQAVASFSRAVEASDEQLRFDALFNLGISYFRQEKWKESLEALKGALLLRPEDEEVKVAYEVALAKVYPPCSALEDESEDNDDKNTATQLQEPEKKEMTLCGGDDDWFAVPLYPGSILKAEAKFKRLREKEPGDPSLLPSAESLRLVMFGPDGEKVIGIADGEPDELPTEDPEEQKKRAARESAKRVVGPVRLTAEMLQIPPPASEQNLSVGLLRVVADESVELKYDLAVKVIPPCFALQEKAEPNNEPFQATPLDTNVPEHPMHVCDGDVDWMKIDVKAGDVLFVDVIAGPDEETETIPELEIGLFDENGQESLSEVETVPTPQGMLYGVELREIPEDRTVLLKVKSAGLNKQGPYRVQVFRYPPCEEGGDDRMEENDLAGAASEFPRGQGPVRHLRLCPNDPDFLKLQAQKKDKIVLGVRYDDAEGDLDSDVAPVAMKLWNEGGDTIVVEGQKIAAQAPQKTPVQLAVATEEMTEDTAFVLEISSPLPAARFYDLIPLDGDKAKPPPQPEQQEQEQNEDQEKDEEQEQDQQQENQGEPEDKEDKEEEKPEEQDSKGDEEDKEEEQEQKEEEAPGDPSEEEERQAQIEEILDNLEESDDNFQLKKTLKNLPERYIENDW